MMRALQDLGRVLAVDLGLKRTGLAISDELWMTARPLPLLQPKSRAEDVAFLKKLCEEQGVKKVLIGYPLMTKSGQEGMMAKRAKGFAAALQDAVGINVEVVLLDESYTSKRAQTRFFEEGGKTKALKNSLDSLAACILLEDFLLASNHHTN